jgi:hypothetical protein
MWKSTNLNIHENANFLQIMKMGIHELKWIHNKNCYQQILLCLHKCTTFVLLYDERLLTCLYLMKGLLEVYWLTVIFIILLSYTYKI